MKAIFLDALTMGENFVFKNFPSNIEIKYYNTTSHSELLSHCEDAEILITNKVKILKDDFPKLKNLKLICISATGMDHIDLVAAKEYGVIVKNVSGYSTASVAQHTLSIALNYLHPVESFYKYTESGQWTDSSIFTHILPFDELKSKKWGIIGLGEIGKKVAQIAMAFDSEVYYYSTSGKNINHDVPQYSLSQLLSECDIISIHCPLNEYTENLLTLKDLKLLKENALVINCGRGGIINENDLADFLDNNCSQTFVLDVLETEPMSGNSPLEKHLKNEKLHLTPHVAWSSKQARDILSQGIINNIKSFLSEKLL